MCKNALSPEDLAVPVTHNRRHEPLGTNRTLAAIRVARSLASYSRLGKSYAFGERYEALPRCPDGKPQRLCHALGFWERNVRELEVAAVLDEELLLCFQRIEDGELEREFAAVMA